MTSPAYACPACGFRVFEEPPGSDEVCPVCEWVNDGVQYADPTYHGGANERSLIEAQRAAVRAFPYETRRHASWRRDPWWRPLMADELGAAREAVAPHPSAVEFVPYWLRSSLEWDTVLTCEWHDGPIAGIANLQGQPHEYAATWDAEADDWNHEVFELRAADDDLVELAIEEWEIGLRGSEAHERGDATLASHPVLPEDRARYEVVHERLEELRASQSPPVHAHPHWGWPRDPPRRRGYLAVRWELLGT